jgi:hypothetical protein
MSFDMLRTNRFCLPTQNLLLNMSDDYLELGSFSVSLYEFCAGAVRGTEPLSLAITGTAFTATD